MIRINLLGQARPKATKQAVPLEATVQLIFLLVAIGFAIAVLGLSYMQDKKQLDQTNTRITSLRAEKASLEQIKTQVEQFEKQKATLQQRIDVIETLQKNRTGGQELLQMVANTVVRVDSLWLTSLNRTQNALQIQGEAGSINAVANLITQLKQSGYFDKVEFTETKENDLLKGTPTFAFNMTASIASGSSPSGPGSPPAAAKPALRSASLRGRE
ncbi:MAG TPA: PilN domain-containing protein [Candidatus Acidoferrales bacterium]|nr:PilN domain-containing protein [Candidatus Acidoferrales bacterium]